MITFSLLLLTFLSFSPSTRSSSAGISDPCMMVSMPRFSPPPSSTWIFCPFSPDRSLSCPAGTSVRSSPSRMVSEPSSSSDIFVRSQHPGRKSVISPRFHRAVTFSPLTDGQLAVSVLSRTAKAVPVKSSRNRIPVAAILTIFPMVFSIPSFLPAASCLDIISLFILH